MIYSDSWIVVAQVNQACATYEKLKPLMTKAYGLLMQGCHVLKQVKGHAGVEGNEEADRLCNEILDGYLVHQHVEEHRKLLKEENAQ
jgi:ribonuclease HI